MPVWALVLIIIFGSIFGIFLLLGLVALIKKPSSIYKNKPQERNPMEGKMVEFVYDENDKENADGVKGHLVAIGDAKPKRRAYNFFKRLLDIILSFGALFLLAPLFLILILAIVIDDPGPVLFTQKRLGKNKRYFMCIPKSSNLKYIPCITIIFNSYSQTLPIEGKEKSHFQMIRNAIFPFAAQFPIEMSSKAIIQKYANLNCFLVGYFYPEELSMIEQSHLRDRLDTLSNVKKITFWSDIRDLWSRNVWHGKQNEDNICMHVHVQTNN